MAESLLSLAGRLSGLRKAIDKSSEQGAHSETASIVKEAGKIAEDLYPLIEDLAYIGIFEVGDDSLELDVDSIEKENALGEVVLKIKTIKRT
jgi:hypothetical protein